MRIRTQLRISLLLFAASLAVAAGSMIWTGQQVYKAGKQERIARRITQRTGELIYLAEDYMMYRENRQLDRWQSLFSVLSADVAALRPEGPEQQEIIRNIRADQQWLKEVFDSWTSAGRIRSQEQGPAHDPVFLQVSWSRMTIQGNALISDASHLLWIWHTVLDRLKQTNMLVFLAVIVLLGLQMVVNHIIIHRRVLKSITTLQTGTTLIGSGDFDYFIEEKKNDEIGDLSRAFNGMTKKLKTVTAKKSDLEREIAERRSAEEKLAQRDQQLVERTELAESRARQLRALVSELTLAEHRERERLGEILHNDLQQVLAAAKLHSIILAKGLDKEQKDVVEKISTLIAQGIQTSRSLTTELSCPVLRTGRLSAALEWLARWMKENHGLAVELQIAPDVDPAKKNVTLLLFQSIRELLFNVVKHSGVKSARLEVGMDEENRLRLTVEDHGIGFDPDTIWEKSMEGTGFGLLSIRERLMMMGGCFKIESSPGNGASFTLVLPIETAKEKDENRIQRIAGRPCGPKKIGDKIRVLLVDDHPVVRQGLSAMLSLHSDIKIVGEAADGKAAVELARELEPDVILMDVSMPEMDGLEATRIIHSESPCIRIIGLSMNGKEIQAASMMEAGASAYCMKDQPAHVLLSAIRGAAGRSIS